MYIHIYMYVCINRHIYIYKSGVDSFLALDNDEGYTEVSIMYTHI
jgi:hypothetical protein